MEAAEEVPLEALVLVEVHDDEIDDVLDLALGDAGLIHGLERDAAVIAQATPLPRL